MNSTTQTNQTANKTSGFDQNQLGRGKKLGASDQNLDSVGFESLFASAMIGNQNKKELFTVQTAPKANPQALEVSQGANNTTTSHSPPSPLNSVASAVQKSISNQRKTENQTKPATQQAQPDETKQFSPQNTDKAMNTSDKNSNATVKKEQTPQQTTQNKNVEKNVTALGVTKNQNQVTETDLTNQTDKTTKTAALTDQTTDSRMLKNAKSDPQALTSNKNTEKIENTFDKTANALDNELTKTNHLKNTKQAEAKTLNAQQTTQNTLNEKTANNVAAPSIAEKSLLQNSKSDLPIQNKITLADSNLQENKTNEGTTIDTKTPDNSKTFNTDTRFQAQDNFEANDKIKGKVTPQHNARADLTAAATQSQASQFTGLKAGEKKLTTSGIDSQKNINAQLVTASTPTGSKSNASSVAQIKTPVNQPGFAKEMAQKINWAIGKNLSTVDLKLNPDQMGTINMRLIQKGNNIQILIRTSDENSASMLQQTVAGLRETLGQNGLNLNQVQINANNQNQQHSNFGQNLQNQQEQNPHKDSNGQQKSQSGSSDSSGNQTVQNSGEKDQLQPVKPNRPNSNIDLIA